MKYIQTLTNKLFITVACLASLMPIAQPVIAQTCCDIDNTATTADVPHISDRFASSLAMDGDTAVVGAPFNDDAEDDGGTAYVFSFNAASSVWDQQQQLLPFGADVNDQFGFSVAIDGNIIVIGAHGVDLPGATNAGAAYIFEFAGGSWSEVAKITASDAQAGDVFGTSVAISGNWIAVGARDEDSAAGNAGAV